MAAVTEFSGNATGQQSGAKSGPFTEYTLATAPSPTGNQGSTVFISDAPGGYVPAYTDGTTYRSFVDGSDLYPFFLDGDYRAFTVVPLAAGDTAGLKAIFDSARNEFKSFTIIGDSQETAPNGSGVTFVTELNRLSFREFGQARATPWYRFGAILSSQMWCTGSEDAGSTELAEFKLPNFPTWQSDASNIGVLSTLYPDAGDLADANDGIYFPADSSTLQWEILLQRSTAAIAEECRIVQLTNTAPRSYFGTRTEQRTIDSTTLSLNTADDQYVVMNTGNLVYSAAQPFITCYARGLVSGTPVANNGMRSVASRWIDTARNKGISWTSFSRGGNEISSYLTDFTGMGSVISGFGPSSFDAVFLQISTNDAGSGLNTPATWKTRLENLVADTRSKFGASQFIVIVSDPPRNDYGGNVNPNLVLNYNRYAAVMGEVATATTNCAFLNLGRALYEFDSAFGVPATSGGTRLSDSVHLTAASQATSAAKIYELLKGL